VKPALFTPEAEADVEEAFEWYEAQRPGLGGAFRRALDIALAGHRGSSRGLRSHSSQYAARPPTQFSVWSVLSRSRAGHRGGRMYARQASPEDVADSMRKA